jgi:hypothetical protein
MAWVVNWRVVPLTIVMRGLDPRIHLEKKFV